MRAYLSPPLLDDLGKLLLRLTLGSLILFHGVAKLRHGIDPLQGMLQAASLPGVLGYGVYLGEVLGPLLLITGYYGRIGAGLIAINMVIAILLVHTHEILSLTEQGGWRLELQGMFLFTALALVLTGPGRLALHPR